MHIRLPVEQLDDYIDHLDRAIRRNLELVADNNYAEASGYARGGLTSMLQRLQWLKSCETHEDIWDYADAEDAEAPSIPAFPSIYGR